MPWRNFIRPPNAWQPNEISPWLAGDFFGRNLGSERQERERRVRRWRRSPPPIAEETCQSKKPGFKPGSMTHLRSFNRLVTS
jgi:hypothetical protein